MPMLSDMLLGAVVWLSVIGIVSYYVAEFTAPIEPHHFREERLSDESRWKPSPYQIRFIAMYTYMLICTALSGYLHYRGII